MQTIIMLSPTELLQRLKTCLKKCLESMTIFLKCRIPGGGGEVGCAPEHYEHALRPDTNVISNLFHAYHGPEKRKQTKTTVLYMASFFSYITDWTFKLNWKMWTWTSHIINQSTVPVYWLTVSRAVSQLLVYWRLWTYIATCNKCLWSIWG